MQAKFSLPFAVAIALADRAAGLEQYTDRKVKDPRVADLMERTHLMLVKYARNGSAVVRITLKDGTSIMAKQPKRRAVTHFRAPRSRKSSASAQRIS